MYFPSFPREKKTRTYSIYQQNGFYWYIVTSKVALWAANFSACVVYTKTIIHLSAGEGGDYLPPLR